MVRWCWVNFQCWGVLLIWITIGQGPSVLAAGADGSCLDIFSLVYHFSFFLSLWETARYRLKYCLNGPLSPKTTNQPKLFRTRENYHRITEEIQHSFSFLRCVPVKSQNKIEMFVLHLFCILYILATPIISKPMSNIFMVPTCSASFVFYTRLASSRHDMDPIYEVFTDSTLFI